MNALSCASAGCREPVAVVAAGVPLCADHRARLFHELRLEPIRYVPKPGRDWHVYYIAWPHMPGLVKIGATMTLAGRLHGHKRDGHYPQVLAVEPGSGDLETERHEQFASLRVERRHEIFRLAPALAEHIEQTAKAYPDWLDAVRPLPWWLNPAISAESWEDVPLCTGTTLEGNPCSRKAGYATDHPGLGECVQHDPDGDGRLGWPRKTRAGRSLVLGAGAQEARAAARRKDRQ